MIPFEEKPEQGQFGMEAETVRYKFKTGSPEPAPLPAQNNEEETDDGRRE